MKTGKGQKTHMVTELPNGYKVSTIKISGLWETMVFDKSGNEVYSHTEPYINEARNYHNIAVQKYISA